MTEILQRLYRVLGLFLKNDKQETIESKYSEIPFYPPFLRGFPAISPEQIISSQSELIGRLKMTCGLNERLNSELLDPLIYRYAAFVHLLPASEVSHHRGVGGLFRHGLEVACLAVRSSDSLIFSMDETPEKRRYEEPLWRFACCTAGLLHDIGKPITDLTVSDMQGSLVWNPMSENLYEWLINNKINKYFIHWKPNRYLKHEDAGILGIDAVITKEVKRYLNSTGRDAILGSVIHAVAHSTTEDTLVKLIVKADSDSAEKDRKENNFDESITAVGIPVVRYVFDSIRKLISEGKWKINKPGGPVYYMEKGVFIDWNFYGDIAENLREDKIYGIPQDRDIVADLIIASGCALENSDNLECGRSLRYFEILPDLSPTVKVRALKIDSIDRIYSGALPGKINDRQDLQIAKNLENSEIKLMDKSEYIDRGASQFISFDGQNNLGPIEDKDQLDAKVSAVASTEIINEVNGLDESTFQDNVIKNEDPLNVNELNEKFQNSNNLSDLSETNNNTNLSNNDSICEKSENKVQISNLDDLGFHNNTKEKIKNTINPDLSEIVHQENKIGSTDVVNEISSNKDLEKEQHIFCDLPKDNKEINLNLKVMDQKEEINNINSTKTEQNIFSETVPKEWRKIYSMSLVGSKFLQKYLEPIFSHQSQEGIFSYQGTRIILDISNESKICFLSEKLSSDKTISAFSNCRFVETVGTKNFVMLNAKISRAILKELKKQNIEISELDFEKIKRNLHAQNSNLIVENLAKNKDSDFLSSRVQLCNIEREIADCVKELISQIRSEKSPYFDYVQHLDEKSVAVPVSVLESIIVDRYPSLSVLRVRQKIRDPKISGGVVINISRQKIILEFDE